MAANAWRPGCRAFTSIYAWSFRLALAAAVFSTSAAVLLCGAAFLMRDSGKR